jgi:hypothetical protein
LEAAVRTVVVQPYAGAGLQFGILELGPGQDIAFGRGRSETFIDLVLDDPRVSRLAGRIRAVEDFWTISNLTRSKTYVVENPEGGGEFIKVPPGRLGAPIPYEFSRVILPAGHDALSFLVFAPQHAYASSMDPATGQETESAFPLDETAKYFLILVALCEPRLGDPSSPMIPTVPQIISRLEDHPSRADLSRAAVNFHIEYLARNKLRVKDQGTEAKADWQRAALVSLALRFDLVRAEHLDLLPRRPRRPGS